MEKVFHHLSTEEGGDEETTTPIHVGVAGDPGPDKGSKECGNHMEPKAKVTPVLVSMAKTTQKEGEATSAIKESKKDKLLGHVNSGERIEEEQADEEVGLISENSEDVISETVSYTHLTLPTKA